jgi:hypothetical protein
MGLLAIVAGCAAAPNTAYQRDGVQYGVTGEAFRGRWWSYYERGVSYLAGGFYQEAAADFEQALRGNDADGWRTRTYGLHFVEYFPNRELGVARFHLGDFDAAENLLQRSLEQVDTERAYFYLDEVTRARIARGDIADDAAPEVAGSLTGALVSERLVPVSVSAADDVAVAEVTVNGNRLYQRGSTEQLAFLDELLFVEGQHAIEVTARDLSDKATTETLAVTVDLTGPTVGIMSPADGLITQDARITIEGIAVDAYGVTRIAIDEETIEAPERASRAPFSREVELSPGANRFIIKAEDAAGNATFTSIQVYQGDPNSMAARLWQTQQRNPLALKHAGLGAVTLQFSLGQVEESAGIHLKSPDPSRPYRHNRTLRVAGDVVLPGGIAGISINGTPLDPLAGAPKESFNRRIPIDDAPSGEEGFTETVTITAQAASGETLEQTYEVRVEPVPLNTKESRMPVAVLAFAGNGVEATRADYLRTTTENAIIAQDRFRVVDRIQLQDVLTEQQLSAALGDPGQAINLGKLVPAHVFLVAEVFPRDAEGIEIKARVIRTETADVVATLDAFADDASAAKIEAACKAISEQLHAIYPRLSGEVVSVRGTQMLLNWTSEDGVREGTYLLVVDQEEPWIDDVTGEVLAEGEYTPLGRGLINNVRSSGAIAQPVEEIEIEQGMPAITM